MVTPAAHVRRVNVTATNDPQVRLVNRGKSTPTAVQVAVKRSTQPKLFVASFKADRFQTAKPVPLVNSKTAQSTDNARLASLQAAITTASAKTKRFQEWYQDGILAKNDYLQAESELEALEAELVKNKRS